MVQNGKVTPFYPALEFYELLEHNYQPNQEAVTKKLQKKVEFNHANYQQEIHKGLNKNWHFAGWHLFQRENSQ